MTDGMRSVRSKSAPLLYLVLGGLFLTALIVCNLIANKFVSVDLGFKTFVLSAGVLPYPITFLVTDLLSELYGRKKTNQIVGIGFLCSAFVLLILWLGHLFPSIPRSPVSSEAYDQVFQNSFRVILSSMIAYLCAQFVDVRLYHFWKDLTKGRHLWLRNNFSTLLSQLLDTTLVILVLFYGSKSTAEMTDMIGDGWLFKALCALVDTAFLYTIVFAIRRYFGAQPNEDLQLHS